MVIIIISIITLVKCREHILKCVRRERHTGCIQSHVTAEQPYSESIVAQGETSEMGRTGGFLQAQWGRMVLQIIRRWEMETYCMASNTRHRSSGRGYWRPVLQLPLAAVVSQGHQRTPKRSAPPLLLVVTRVLMQVSI